MAPIQIIASQWQSSITIDYRSVFCLSAGYANSRHHLHLILSKAATDHTPNNFKNKGVTQSTFLVKEDCMFCPRFLSSKIDDKLTIVASAYENHQI